MGSDESTCGGFDGGDRHDGHCDDDYDHKGCYSQSGVNYHECFDTSNTTPGTHDEFAANDYLANLINFEEKHFNIQDLFEEKGDDYGKCAQEDMVGMGLFEDHVYAPDMCHHPFEDEDVTLGSGWGSGGSGNSNITESILSSLMSQSIGNTVNHHHVPGTDVPESVLSSLTSKLIMPSASENTDLLSSSSQSPSNWAMTKIAAVIASAGLASMIVDCFVHGSIRSLFVIGLDAFKVLSTSSEAMRNACNNKLGIKQAAGFIFEWQQAASFNVNAIMSGRVKVTAILTSAIGRSKDKIDIVFRHISGKLVGVGYQLKTGDTMYREVIHKRYDGLCRAVSALNPQSHPRVKIENCIKHNGVCGKPTTTANMIRMTEIARGGGNPLSGAQRDVALRIAARVAGRAFFVGGAVVSAYGHIRAYINDEEVGGDALLGVLKDVTFYTLGEEIVGLLSEKDKGSSTQ